MNRDWPVMLREVARTCDGLNTGALFDAPERERGAVIGSFRDELGRCRRMDTVFLAGALRVPEAAGPPRDDAERAWVIAGGAEGAIDQAHPIEPERAFMDRLGLEAWTELALWRVNAFWAAARVTRDGALTARVTRAATALAEEIQPDNATNRAWGVGAFIDAHAGTGEPSCALMAETLVQNCQVTFGGVDRLSAIVLEHTARTLQGR